jgi:hypothetical protein
MSNPVSFPWWYHGLAQGWNVVERTSAAEPTVGWKVIFPQSIGWITFILETYKYS